MVPEKPLNVCLGLGYFELDVERGDLREAQGVVPVDDRVLDGLSLDLFVVFYVEEGLHVMFSSNLRRSIWSSKSLMSLKYSDWRLKGSFLYSKG